MASPTNTGPVASPRRLWWSVAVWAVGSSAAALGLLALQPVTGPDPAILVLVMFAPAIGAAACWPLFRSGLSHFPARQSAGRFAAVLGLALLAVAIYVAVISIAQGEPPSIPREVAGVPVAAMIAAQTVGALGEEIGFRGILLHALLARFPRPLAAVVVGLLFGFWHIQYFGLPLLQHAAFVVGSVALTVTMTYVMAGSFWQRMAVCTIIHVGANLSLAFAGGEPLPMPVFCLAIVAGGAVVLPLARLVDARAVAD